jgi:hypothetical protein
MKNEPLKIKVECDSKEVEKAINRVNIKINELIKTLDHLNDCTINVQVKRVESQSIFSKIWNKRQRL